MCFILVCDPCVDPRGMVLDTMAAMASKAVREQPQHAPSNVCVSSVANAINRAVAPTTFALPVHHVGVARLLSRLRAAPRDATSAQALPRHPPACCVRPWSSWALLRRTLYGRSNKNDASLINRSPPGDGGRGCCRYLDALGLTLGKYIENEADAWIRSMEVDHIPMYVPYLELEGPEALSGSIHVVVPRHCVI